MSPEEAARAANWLANLWKAVFVYPKLSLRPGPEEIHPDMIPEPDQKFIWKWIRGEVKDSGESLSPFVQASKDDLVLLDILGRRYSCRPSAILRGMMLDFHIDLAACLAGEEGLKNSPAEEGNTIDW